MFSPEMIGVLGLVVLFILLMLRMPVGITMVLVGIGGTFALSLAVKHVRFEPYIKQFKSLLWSTMANYDLSVVPLFVLMGYLASRT
jgi:TRAP-type mannitol/chloroaromatic compound transport system permease large subunit